MTLAYRFALAPLRTEFASRQICTYTWSPQPSEKAGTVTVVEIVWDTLATVTRFVGFSPAPAGSINGVAVANDAPVTFHKPTTRRAVQGGVHPAHEPPTSLVETLTVQGPVGKSTPPAASTIQPLPFGAGEGTIGEIVGEDVLKLIPGANSW